MAISTRTKFEIRKRDGFKCRYCGVTPMGALLHIDHVIAVANGGTDDHENLVTSCRDCNLGKSAVPLEERRLPEALSAEDAKEHATQLRAYLKHQKGIVNAKKEITAVALQH